MGRNWSSPLLEFPNKWHKAENADIWEYGNYKCCYLCVRKTEENKFLPTVNGSCNIRTKNWIFTDNTPLLFDTLEEAQQQCFKYMDAIREDELQQSKNNAAYLKQFLARYVDDRKDKL